MHADEGTRQRTLFRVNCEWGELVIPHEVLYSIFERDYKVRGMIGWSQGQSPLWYPAVPGSVRNRTIRFKVPFLDELPLPLESWEPGLLEGAFFCDSWQNLTVALASAPNAAQLGTWRDLHGQRIRAGSIVDVVLEPPLHRVRGLIVRQGLFRLKTYSILELPSLAESLAAADAVPARLRVVEEASAVEVE